LQDATSSLPAQVIIRATNEICTKTGYQSDANEGRRYGDAAGAGQFAIRGVVWVPPAADTKGGAAMITPDEIVEMTDLTPDEVAAIGEHERISEICAAAALADWLMHQRDGPRTIRRMIREDMRDALRAGNAARARALYATLRHFVAAHPEAAAH
jgi:hypothetical protein